MLRARSGVQGKPSDCGISARNLSEKLRRIGLLWVPLWISAILVISDAAFALPFDPKWGEDPARDALSVENRRGPDPIHQLAPVNPGLGSPGGRLESDGGANSGNYHLAIPLINLSGRGLGLSLVLFYNSQIWYRKGGPQFDIDPDGDWPVPGCSIGFGKLIFPNGGMMIEPDGTRRPLSPPEYEMTEGRYTGRVAARFADGSGGSVECPRGSDGCNRPGHVVTVRLGNGRQAEFVSKTARWTDTNVYYPERLWDVHGNFIKIDYLRDASGNPNPPLIDRITDTVGRVVQFHYDSRGLPVALSGPDQVSSPRVYARFTYRWLDLRVGVPSTILPPQFFALEGVFFPGNKTGYVFEDFTPFGIPRTVSLNRDMGVTASSLTEQGILQKGKMTRKSSFNYPSNSDHMRLYRKLPSYSQRTDSWADPVASREVQAIIRYSKSGGTTTVTYPDGSRVKQTSVTNRGRWDYGLASSTQWLGTNGRPISTTRYIWEQGAENIPRQKEVQFVQHEIGAERRVEFLYGANNMQVAREIYYDNVPIGQLANAPVVMRKSTAFVQTRDYLDRNLNLPSLITVDGGTDNLIYERTGFQYDSHPVLSLSADLNPPIANYARNLAAFPLGPRGNLTAVTRYLAFGGGPVFRAGDRLSGISTDYFYDETGNLRKVQGAGVPSATVYEFEGETQYSLPAEVSVGSIDPGSTVRLRTSSRWNVGLGLPLSITDPDGNRTEFSYQPAAAGWRLRTSRLPTGLQMTYDFEDEFLGLGIHVADAEGGEYYRSLRYDGRGMVRERRMRLREGGGHEIAAYEYDPMGRLTVETLPRRTTEGRQPPRLVLYSYDSAGRLSSIAQPDGSTTRWFHNEVSKRIPSAPAGAPGETVRSQDPWLREIWKKFDSFGRIRYVVEPNAQTGKVTLGGGQLTEYHYDVLGRLTQIRQGPQMRSFQYDTLSRMTAAKYPERAPTLDSNGAYAGSSGTWSDVFEYDPLSNLVGYTDARGAKTIWRYGGDPLNRIQSIVYDLSGVGDTSSPVLPASSVTVTYVSSGNLLRPARTTADGASRERREYDSFGRVSRLDAEFLGFHGIVLTSEYAYDSLNRLRTMRYPAFYEDGAATGARELTYQYSRDGELTGLHLGGNPVATGAEYDARGLRRLNLSLGASRITENYEYSLNGRIRRQTVAEGGTERKLLDLEYGYLLSKGPKAESGQITIQNDLLEPSNRQAFRYDALGRLAEAQAGSEPPTRQTYTYDVHGNRARVDAAEFRASTNRWVALPAREADGVSFAVDPATNRIASPGFRYDAAGNLIEGPGIGGSPQRYVYDAAGRLVRAESAAGALIEAYQYGADRRRTGVSPNLRDWRLSFWTGFAEIARYDKPESGGLTWREMPIYFGGRLLGDMRRGQKGLRFFHADQRGTALLSRIARIEGLESVRISTLPFGKDRTAALQSGEERIFTRYERSDRTGLDYAVNRFYDPGQGRFIQPDSLAKEAMSLGDPGSLNLYSYVRNDPVNRVDPLGLKDEQYPPCDLENPKEGPCWYEGNVVYWGPTVVVTPGPLSPPGPPLLPSEDPWFSPGEPRQYVRSNAGREIREKEPSQRREECVAARANFAAAANSYARVSANIEIFNLQVVALKNQAVSLGSNVLENFFEQREDFSLFQGLAAIAGRTADYGSLDAQRKGLEIQKALLQADQKAAVEVIRNAEAARNTACR